MAIQNVLHDYRTGRKHHELFPQRWLPAARAILPEGFTEDNGLLNSTMKVVRGKVTERYATLIENLYTPEGKELLNKNNVNVLRSLL